MRQVQATILQIWQYFHVWRSSQFDEATDTIDGYIQKVKQVTALLDYGEPQILVIRPCNSIYSMSIIYVMQKGHK